MGMNAGADVVKLSMPYDYVYITSTKENTQLKRKHWQVKYKYIHFFSIIKTSFQLSY